MGCKYCVYMGNEDDCGGDYPSNSFSVCNAEMSVSNLKGFPFKKIPTPCKKIFSIDFWHLPYSSRVLAVEDILCNDLCRKVSLSFNQKECNQDCDAFNFIVGKTDISLSNFPVKVISDLLKIMKFKKPFEFATYKTCTECKGEGVINTNKSEIYNFELCPKCNGQGKLQLNLPIIKKKIITATCKTCGNSRKINRVNITKTERKHTLYCYSCKKEYGIKNFKIITKTEM